MVSIAHAHDPSLAWVQTRPTEHVYELRHDQELLATVRWATTFGQVATAQTAEGSWSFERGGVFRTRVHVRESATGREVAVFRAGWGSDGWIQFADGLTYSWTRQNFWHGQWTLADEQGQVLLRYEPSVLGMMARTQMTVEPAGVSHPGVGLLAALGWYLMTLMSEEANASLAMTAAVSG